VHGSDTISRNITFPSPSKEESSANLKISSDSSYAPVACSIQGTTTNDDLLPQHSLPEPR
jgi:hypothetical protein